MRVGGGLNKIAKEKEKVTPNYGNYAAVAASAGKLQLINHK